MEHVAEMEYKFQRRDKKRNQKKTKMPQHGRDLGYIYKNSISERAKRAKEDSK